MRDKFFTLITKSRGIHYFFVGLFVFVFLLFFSENAVLALDLYRSTSNPNYFRISEDTNFENTITNDGNWVSSSSASWTNSDLGVTIDPADENALSTIVTSWTGDILVIDADVSFLLGYFTYVPGSPVLVVVSGTLNLGDVAGLNLPNGSEVVVLTGGTLSATNIAGIVLEGDILEPLYDSGDGVVNGPAVIDIGGIDAGALPIDLYSFTAIPQQESVELNWATASELNNDYFEVQRSIDGRTYETIGEVLGAGDSDTRIDYSFEDEEPLSGDVFYRLKQIDFDGKYSYYIVRVSVQNDSEAFTIRSLSANPLVYGDLNYQVYLPKSSQVWMQLYNTKGEVLYENRAEMAEGYSRLSIPEDRLKSGVLLLKITEGTSTQTLKIIKE